MKWYPVDCINACWWAPNKSHDDIESRYAHTKYDYKIEYCHKLKKVFSSNLHHLYCSLLFRFMLCNKILTCILDEV